jgi:hypothetical protein
MADKKTEMDVSGEKMRMETFCIAYTTIGAETFNKSEKSAIEAGYSESSARNAGTRLLRNPEVQKRILELHEENCGKAFVTETKVLADIEHDKIKAREKGDYASAIKADQLHGQFLAMFSEKFRIMNEGTPPPEMSKEETTAAEKASRELVIELAKLNNKN